MEDLTFVQFCQTFNTEEQCRKFLYKSRWEHGVTCPRCGVINVRTYVLASGRYKCARCHNTFTIRTRSVFEDSPIPLQSWFLAIYLCASYRKGISSVQLSKYIGVTQKTAWFMLQRIRHVFENDSFELSDNEI